MENQVISELATMNANLVSIIKRFDEGVRPVQEILPYERAMTVLDCSRKTLDRLREEGIIKVYKLKGKLFLRYSELLEVISSNMVPADQLIESETLQPA